MIIPFEPLWAHYRRLLKPRGAVVLMASQPFTSMLVMSNREWFKYCWTWEKERGSGFARSGFQPMRIVEDIAVFSRAPAAYSRTVLSMNYFPQLTPLDKPYSRPLPISKSGSDFVRNHNGKKGSLIHRTYTHKQPVNLLRFPRDNPRLHPTQKPVALMEYLIRTYSNEGDTVLDNAMGSGTTGLACLNTGRNFIGIEKHEPYFRVAQQRLAPFHLIA